MHDFYGTVFLRDDPDSVLDAKVTIDLNRIVITADDSEIGSWRHSDVAVKKDKDRVLVEADGETLVLELEGQDFFLDLLGVNETEPKSKRQKRREAEYSAEKRPGFSVAEFKTAAVATTADPMDRPLAIVLGIAGFVVLIGAGLTWGSARIMDAGSFPIGRLLAAFGGLAGLLALYLGYFDRNRSIGSAAAATAGVVTFGVVVLYARAARLGVGFLLVLIGAQAMIAVGALGLMRQRPADDPTE